MQSEFEKLKFVEGAIFDFINSLKNYETKNLLNVDDSNAGLCKSNEFVDIANAGRDRNRGFSTIAIKHNLFHQRELGRDVALQNTHSVLFKSSREAYTVGTLKIQLVLGSTCRLVSRFNNRSF